MNDDYELKKYEELYSLSKTELEKGHARYTSIEEKTTRHFSVLVFILGLVSITIPEYIAVVKSQSTWLHKSFVFIYPILAINVFLSIFFHLRALSFSKYKNVVLNQEMFDHFRNHKYIDVIYSMSKRFADDLETINNVTDAKIKRATIAFRFTYVSLALVALTILVYVLLKLQ
jgi:heme/copper-type cytochrome/quinol oxidase subunit 4